MKLLKIVPIMVMALLLSLSCYLDTTNSKKVSFRLSNSFDPAVTRFHIAAYEGSGSPGDATLLAYEVVSPDVVVELEVPTGSNRVVTIWAETTPGTAKWYGVTAPIDVDSGSTEQVDIQMWQFSYGPPDNFVFNLRPDKKPVDFILWNALYGADNYLLQIVGIAEYYYGPNNEYHPVAGGGSCTVTAYSSLFNLVSVTSVVAGF